MTTAAHTPGPWDVDAVDDDMIFAANGLYVAAIGNSEQEQPDEKLIANACLIAAAPELLEALKALHQFVTLESDLAFHPANVYARAIIAKANGGAI